MNEITMPRLSDSMEEGTVLTWLKQDGEHVEPGDDLLEIETDKATVTHQSEFSGTLSIVAPEGATLPVGAQIAVVGDAADKPVQSSDHPTATSGVELTGVAGSPVGGNGTHSEGGLKVTPLARRVARVHGVSLEDIAGTGPLGRVTRADVLAKAGLSPAAVRPPATPPRDRAPSRADDVEVVELTRLQAIVAQRMADAKATVPHFQVQTEVAMDAAMDFRAQIRETGAAAPSLNDLIVKAAALALRRHPQANGSYRDGTFELYAGVHVGIAVAAEGALVVPTIFDADKKSLGTIAEDSARLAERVRDGSIAPHELSGATFTVSNLGMYGMTAITPVINAPQAAILGVGAARTVLARVDGEIVDRRLMTLTLSCDHRILYGADAARFLSDIRELLEQPLRLAL